MSEEDYATHSGEPTLEEQREMFTAAIAEAEHELHYARERLKEVEREIARRDLMRAELGIPTVQ